MQHIEVEQGSMDWLQARIGIPTASGFEKIITPTGKPSAQAEAYSEKLLAEYILGYPVETFTGNAHTERGKELEPQAVKFYEVQKDIDTKPVGFCTDDARTMGASPDRLVGDDGLLEIKCPAPQTHVHYLLTGEIDKGYWPQVQGQLLVTGRKWVDWLSYHPEMPPVIIRVERDEEYLATMEKLLKDFTEKLEKKREKLISQGYLERKAA